MIRRSGRVFPALTILASIALLAGGCRDDLASPTKGFLEVDAGGVGNVEVLVDGVSQGIDPGRIGPIPAGTYLVAARREGFVASPAGAMEVEVLPAQTARPRFTLVAVEFGAVAVSASDEITGAVIDGAEIFRREGDDFVATGLVTPAILADLPVGPVEVLVRSADHADGRKAVSIAAADTAQASVELGPLRKVLAEMFTYVGCPNCPEAADSLQSLQVTRPGRVFVVEWHTWAGRPFYDPRWVEREAAYGGGQFWPAVVLQGGYADDPALLIGSQTAELLQYRIRADSYLAECEGDCDYALVADGTERPGAWDLTARVKWRGGAPRSDLALRFVLVEREAPAGSVFFHDVPRNLAERAVSFTSPGEVLEFEASLTIDPAWSHLDYVVYLQSDATLEILAVDGTS